MPIIPIIESALGLGTVEDIMAHPSVLQCAFGHLDFSLDIGAESHWEALHYARGRVVLASRLGNKALLLMGFPCGLMMKILSQVRLAVPVIWALVESC